MTRLRTILLSGLLLGVVTACGGTSGEPAAAPSSSGAPGPATTSAAPPTSAASTAAAPAVVTIEDFGYAAPASVAPGATVRVTNADGEAHTVTADSGGAFDAMVAGKGTATFTAPTKPGRYPFHCTYHGNMHGVLVVA